MSRRRKQEAPEIAFRAASVRSSSFDEAGQTVEVVWSTGAAVRRYDWWNERPYDEVLDMSPSAVRLDRMNGGAPFLDSHRSGTIANVIGSVVPGTARIENGKGVCRVQLSRADGDADTVQKIKDGVIRNISAGYKVHKIEKTRASKDGEVDQWRIVDWEPLEISAVPIPADPKATIRSSQMPNHADHENETVTKPQKRAPRAMTEIEIRAFAQQAKLPDHWVDEQIEAGVTKAAMHRAAVDFRAEEQAKEGDIIPYVRLSPYTGLAYGPGGPGADMHDPAVRGQAMAEAIAVRALPSLEPSPVARQYVGLSLPELARESLRSAGVDVRGMGQSEVVKRSLGGLHSTSDFAVALSGAASLVLRNAYEAAPSGLKPIARRVTLSDFRAKTFVTLSGMSALEKVNEHGEFKRGTLKDSGEHVKLDTFGRVFGITRQAIINDDIGFIADLPRKLGIAASQFEASMLADLLLANPLMADGKALFHADHSNLAASGGAPSEATLSAARLAMRRQADESGQLIGVGPRYLVVGPELETDAEKLMTAITATATDDVQPIRLSIAVEPRIPGKQWYLVADPGVVDGLVFAHLAGEPGPQIEHRVGFDVDGVEMRVRIDFGASFIDHRSWYRNAGQ